MVRLPALGFPAAPCRVEVTALHEPDALALARLESLIERAARHDRHRPVMEHALLELRQGRDLFPHAALVARVDDVPIGYAHLSKRETRSGWRLELVVAPEWRGRGLARRLAERIVDHVARHGGGHLHAWAYRPGPAHERLAEHLGMRPTRRLFLMERDLPAPTAPAPPGVRLRPFAPEDGPAWLALHNRAFAEHPDGGAWRPADLEWHVAEPWFDPSGFLLAEEVGGLVGYVWMKPEGERAWVYFLGVHPERRGRGLAPFLLGAGLAWASSRGARRARLYVDEDNEPAVRLYRRFGFRTDHLDVCYELDVPPAGEPAAAGDRG
jgi:mycothiol synthase